MSKKIQQPFINMKSRNTEIKLGMFDLRTGTGMVFGLHGPKC